MAQARLQRDTFESVYKAWNARTITTKRIAELRSQVASGRKVIAAYSKEYDLGQRSLIDLLNAENQLFNAQVSLESARGVAVFADYQLLAMMGELLAYLKAPHPVDAEPLAPHSFGLFPNELPPIMISLPNPGPEPLSTLGQPTTPFYSKEPPPPPARPAAHSFAERWSAATEKLADSSALAFSADPFSPMPLAHLPIRPTEGAKD
jgi:adhesin transport system outer membrane protein